MAAQNLALGTKENKIPIFPRYSNILRATSSPGQEGKSPGDEIDFARPFFLLVIATSWDLS